MSDRGMKKWNAYKSLPEHDPAIRGAMDERYKVPRPTISSEEAELINEILVTYHGEEVSLEYYHNGEINKYTGTLKKIDEFNRKIITSDNQKIPLHELVGLKRVK